MTRLILILVLYNAININLLSQNIKNNPSSSHGNKFEQLGIILPDPGPYRTAAGAPGEAYWQQKADYKIKARLDEEDFRLYGSEWISYHNQSPHELHYLWLQLDENQHKSDDEFRKANPSNWDPPFYENTVAQMDHDQQYKDLGVNITKVTDAAGNNMPYVINGTMMRIDLSSTLKSKSSVKFFVAWNYKIPNRLTVGGRGGFEKIEDDGNCLFTMSQWYPRMCVYSDFQGWQNKQFTGRAEFALTFGDFDVEMDVPSDHVIASTGECQNYKSVVTDVQWQRYQNAIQKNGEVTEIVTLAEATRKESSRSKERKVWHYKASNVRDFAWGTSRKFVWDLMPIQIGGHRTLCMSYYGKEAYGLYRRYSTKTVAHTIRTYSKYTIDYPYPVAISVEASNGMEYPMICFNYGRTEKDGSYSEGTKYGMISVIIHEVGHNFFPMIINSDERQWTWMDEGLNTFVQFLAEQEFDNNYPSGRGFPENITDYMRLPKEQLEPIMTNSDNLIHFGSNAYAKTATGLNILRETVMGRALFDKAFKTYAQSWKFKHPTPADFFRTMEDASAVDLDWFWRGWFFDIEPTDISIDSVLAYRFTSERQATDSSGSKVQRATVANPAPSPMQRYEPLSKLRNRQSGIQFLVNTDTTLRDFYYYYDVSKEKEEQPAPQNPAPKRSNALPDLADSSTFELYKDYYVYEISFTNKGGMIMPLILMWYYQDGTQELEHIHPYVWRQNEKQLVKTFIKHKEVKSITLDPYRETADIDESNNVWNQTSPMTKFELFKSKQQGQGGRRQAAAGSNPMQKAMKKK
ncbi:MAG TPA: M1 family metallopeptidase [Saprospiraceae bacterium]|nr:M1 family metallopeptidase [Saprospiraceae bacterium]